MPNIVKNKKLLTLDDLYSFYFSQGENCTFSAKESGYQVSVQIPAQFKIEKKDDDGTLLFCKVKLMHSGQNRNHSCVTDKALKEAAKHLAYKPILANFMEYEDEETGEILKDFTSHDMEFNDDGTINYIEKQIGCFTSDEPFFEIEEETGHNFLYGYCAIPREYTDACSVIERKGGTKVSVELDVNEMKYDSKSKLLELTDVTIMGATCLGKDPETLKDVGEGMLNARLDIADFSAENNSLFLNYDSKLVEMQERLNKLESACFNNKNENKGKEDIEVDNKEHFEKVTEAEEVEATETEENTEEEVTETDNSSENVTEESSEEAETTEEQSEEVTEEKRDYSVTVTYADKKFAVSLQEKIFAIQDLVNATYSEQDNTYYGVSVYEDYVVMQDYWNSRYFKQTYSNENNTYSLTGDRVEVFAEFVTADEQKELESMRSNYAALKKFKETAEKNELHAQREAILDDTKFAVISEKDADGKFINATFAELYKNMDNYSLTDLEKEAKVILADYSVEVGKFAEKGNPNNGIKLFGNPNNKKSKTSRYGDLFRK